MKLKKISKLLKKLHLFDYVLLGAALVVSVSFFVFFFRKTEYLEVVIKVTDQDILYAKSNPPSWFAHYFQKGMKSKDGLGRLEAEITDVYMYDSSTEHKATYLTLRLKTVHSNRTGEYKFQGTSLIIGQPVRIPLETILAQGLVVEIEGVEQLYEEEVINVEAIIEDHDPVFSETTGVDSYISAAIKVGDTVQDSVGRVMAEILEVKTQPARKNVTTQAGQVFDQKDPRRKDITLNLKVKVKKINNELYFFDDRRIKIGLSVPLHFPNISIYPVVTLINK